MKRTTLFISAALWLPVSWALTAAPNTLTPQEVAAGWKLLFDGATTSGWHRYGTNAFPTKGWRVEQGCLVNPRSNGRPNGSGGDLVTNATFTNFEFQFEWRIGPGGNSGVEYLFTEGAKRTTPFYPGDQGDSPLGFEYQVLDDAAHAKSSVDRLAASIYSLVAATRKSLRPVGEFNQGGIIVNGNHVEHWLNGSKVAETELGSPALQRIIASSKFKGYPGFGTKIATAIALQDHGEEVAFRNLKIRELRPAANPVAVVPPLPAATTGINPSDWRVWCWSKKDKRWIEHPLEKMTVQIQNGVLSVRNTTNSNWPRAILVYHRALLGGDFTALADYRGKIESFDLQAADGHDRRISCLGLPQDDQWRTVMLSRRMGQFAARLGETPITPQVSNVQGQLTGYVCFKLRPDEAIEIRNVRVQQVK